MATQLENNTVNLQAILDAVNALPEAGGSSENLDDVLSKQDTLLTELETVLAGKVADGGSASVDVCSVKISYDMSVPGYMFTCYVDGAFHVVTDTVSTRAVIGGSVTIDNVVCGSGFYVSSPAESGHEGVTLVKTNFFQVTAAAGETALLMAMS